MNGQFARSFSNSDPKLAGWLVFCLVRGDTRESPPGSTSTPRSAPMMPCSMTSPPKPPQHYETHTASEPDSAAELLIVFGDNPQRIRSEAAFIKLCGTCPIPASSGQTNRHRLYRGGHRQANAALYRVAIVRMRFHQPTIDYVARRTTEDLSKKRHHPLPETVPRSRATMYPDRSRRQPRYNGGGRVGYGICRSLTPAGGSPDNGRGCDAGAAS